MSWREKERIKNEAENYMYASGNYGEVTFEDFLKENDRFIGLVLTNKELIPHLEAKIEGYLVDYQEVKKTSPKVNRYAERYEEIDNQMEEIGFSIIGMEMPNSIEFLDYYLRDYKEGLYPDSFYKSFQKKKELLLADNRYMRLYDRKNGFVEKTKEENPELLTFVSGIDVHEYNDLKHLAGYLMINKDDPDVKEFCISHFEDLVDAQLEIAEWSLSLAKMGFQNEADEDDLLLFPLIQAIIRSYGEEPEVQRVVKEYDLIGYATMKIERMSKYRDEVNSLDVKKGNDKYKDFRIYQPDMAYYFKYKDDSVVDYFYVDIDNTYHQIIVSIASIPSMREWTLSRMRAEGTIQASMRRVSTKGTGDDSYTSTRGEGQIFLEEISWYYGAELIPLLKEADLDIEPMYRYHLNTGFNEDQLDRETEYGSGLRWLVENFDQHTGSFWKSTTIKGASSDSLGWAFINIFKGSTQQQREEIFELMDETDFESKYNTLKEGMTVQGSPEIIILDAIYEEFNKWKEEQEGADQE